MKRDLFLPSPEEWGVRKKDDGALPCAIEEGNVVLVPDDNLKNYDNASELLTL
ncbi:hypothetical protein [Methanosphaerula palustris]|uniref:hypothetical protein n=1 Tax=Methanosphaerula palustris TaxID=475088 RepID=UPI0013052B4A|nr:hypothetical protein [Methanosphaerula palustris]